jgi:hypothetical protein
VALDEAIELSIQFTTTTPEMVFLSLFRTQASAGTYAVFGLFDNLVFSQRASGVATVALTNPVSM